MADKVLIFWPGDYRQVANENSLPEVRQLTKQITEALRKLGQSYEVIEQFIRTPHQAIELLGSRRQRMIALCAHWFYAPHVFEGVVGNDNPLLLASNFDGRWPGLVGLLNAAACLEFLGRAYSRIWSQAADWSSDEQVMTRLSTWLSQGRLTYPDDEISQLTSQGPEVTKLSQKVAGEIRDHHVLALTLGDTSMGMVNAYFGPRLLSRIGFAEHKVDQAWLIHRGGFVSDKRIDEALAFIKNKGINFHYREEGAEDFNEQATREQLRDYLAVLDLIKEFEADCVGWQYQLGLINLRPPSDFAEGLLNSRCRPESDGHPIACATEADQGSLISMQLMKLLLREKKLHEATFCHDLRWGAEYEGRFLWVLQNSGSCGAYAYNHDPDSLLNVHSYRQPAQYFPIPGGTFTGVAMPGKITWARVYLKDDVLGMDVGTGEVVELPPNIRQKWWNNTTPQWPFMPAYLGVDQQTIMAHYLSNHITVAYGDIALELACLAEELGLKVRLIGIGTR
jgi:L-fucose isomerase-like protein